jgi:hypothetical protein
VPGLRGSELRQALPERRPDGTHGAASPAPASRSATRRASSSSAPAPA